MENAEKFDQWCVLGSAPLACCYSNTAGDIKRMRSYLTLRDGAMKVPDVILRWIPVEELQVLVKYFIADAIALTIFKFLTVYAGFLFPDQHGIIVNIELTGLFLLIAAALVLMIIKIVQIGVRGIRYGQVGIIFA